MKRRLAVVFVLIVAGCTVAGVALGFYTGKNAGVEDVNRNSSQLAAQLVDDLTTETNRGIEEQHRFQECLLALINIPQEQRRTLSVERIEEVCHIDIAAVKSIQQQLTQ